MNTTSTTRFRTAWWLVAVGLLCLGAGFLVRPLIWSPAPAAAPSPEAAPAEQAAAKAERKIKHWSCSMHPEIIRKEKGKCPKCGMDLIPIYEGSGAELPPRSLQLSPAAAALAEIRTSLVERRIVAAEVRMVGKVTYDETRLAYVTAWVGGRLDRLYVDTTGIPVRKGDHMVYLYSPELYQAQEELLEAVKAVALLEKTGAAGGGLGRARGTLAAAEEKLRLWGATGAQVDEIKTRGTPSDHMTIYAPQGGIVIHKNGLEGMYVQTGTRIYTIADLRAVWVTLEAYETDLEWLRYGQKVSFTVESFPGETFEGRISFIEPFLDDATRTVAVRVNVPNEDGRLKPGMFVRGIVKAMLAGGGKVVAPDIAGKWICPMHPEVIQDKPGTCPICGMPLETTEALGYTSAGVVSPSLVIPVSAPLITGKRAVVYVRLGPEHENIFQGREIVLGPRAGDWYIVRSGLEEGERVVTRGNFKLDSELQIQAKPSMMSPKAGGGGDEHQQAADRKPLEKLAPAVKLPAAFTSSFGNLFSEYLSLGGLLAADDAVGSRKAGAAVGKLLKGVVDADLPAAATAIWKARRGELAKAVSSFEKAVAESTKTKDGIEPLRRAFLPLSEAMTRTLRSLARDDGKPVNLFRCPMAFGGRGGTWLGEGDEVFNPYYGSAMLRCGDVIDSLKTLAPAGKKGGER